MTHSKARRKYRFTRFAAFLRSVQCLTLALILVQATDQTDPGSNPSSTPDTDQTPPVDTITEVPGTISDAACESGQRNVVKTYRNGALMTTERKDCVG